MEIVIISSIGIIYVISSFFRKLYENCALLGYYAASSGNSLVDVSGTTYKLRGFLTLEVGTYIVSKRR